MDRVEPVRRIKRMVESRLRYQAALDSLPNAPAQAGRASDVRLQTERQSRPCLQPDGVRLTWA